MEINKKIESFISKKSYENRLTVAVLFFIAIIATVICYPGLVIAPHEYRLGDIAEKDIKAPRDFLVQDDKATQEKREEARKEVRTIYDYDPSLAQKTVERIHKAFAMCADIIRKTEQNYKSAASANPSQDKLNNLEGLPGSDPEAAMIKQLWNAKPRFEKILGIPVSDGAYQLLIDNRFSSTIADLITRIYSEILQNGVVANKELLLEDNDKGIILKRIDTGQERAEFNLKHYYGLDQAKTMVRIIGDPLLRGMDYNLINLIVDMTQRLIQPNITLNRSETEKRKKEAEEAIKPIMYQIKQGEMIVREGERITQVDMLKLEQLHQQTQTGQLLERAAGTILIIFILITITFFIHYSRRIDKTVKTDKHLLFITVTLLLFLLITRISVSLAAAVSEIFPVPVDAKAIYFGIPVSAGAMTICAFLGFSASFPFAIIMALISGIIMEGSYTFTLFFLINGVLGAYWMQNAGRRKDHLMAGVKLGLFNMLFALVINLYSAEFTLFQMIVSSFFGLIGGISAGIVTTGLAPVAESLFGLTTDTTLLELSHLDQPLMRRLMLEAPGTYHHSVIVGSLAEAAAAEIGGNPLLAKVCGYYHDIGKLKHPLHFIENQKDGKNIHNKLAPSMSCLILTSHVKHGLELARENKLGQPIIDAISQHHGTTLISFFYEKAKKLKKDQNIDEDNFRYPGPKPRTKETALVMLADQVEAAARTLEDPSSSRIQGLVNQIINKAFIDKQLDESPLTLKDLHKISRSFVNILTGIYHHRIEYPDKTNPGTSKEKNGNISQKHPEQVADTGTNSATGGQGGLKRLGKE